MDLEIYLMRIEDLKILVIGDVMLDRYIIGSVDRISPEAPVPVVRVINETHSLGGAGNTVNNIAQLGAEVSFIYAVGNDTTGNIITEELNKIGVKRIPLYSSKTTEKIRLMGNDTQIARFDREISQYSDISSLSNINFNSFHAIVISDYNKGVVNKELMNLLPENGTIIVNPKPKNAHLFTKATILTANAKEMEDIREKDIDLSNVKHIITTLGKEGILVGNYHITGHPVEVYNVSGAGDTVTAILSVCYCLGYDIITCAKIADACARYVVAKKGTSFVPKDVFYEILNNTLTDKQRAILNLKKKFKERPHPCQIYNTNN